MSRIAKYPVVVPDKVDVTVGATDVTVKGPLGTLKQTLASRVVVKREGDKVTGIHIQCSCGQLIDLACVYNG